MDSKCIILQVIWRVLLMMAATGLFFYALQQERWYVTAAASAVVILVSGWLLVRYTMLIRREWAQFLLAVHEKDYQQYATTQQQSSSDPLRQAFATVVTALRDARIEKEVQFHFLQTLVNHIQLAMISFRSDGRVYFMNDAFCGLFQVPEVSQLSRLRTWHAYLFHALSEETANKNGMLHLEKPRSMQLAMRRSQFRLEGEVFTIVSFQDIKKELDAGEMASWQKLTRVLTHEIMNSVTPLSSLSVEAVELLEESREATDTEKQSLQDLLHQSLQTIASRSDGLLQFVKRYKQFSHPPTPQLASVHLHEVIKNAAHLLHRDFDVCGIRVSFAFTEEVDRVLADKQLLEQVFINILLNAKEALKDETAPRITVQTERTNDEWVVNIVDNGPGMPEEVIQKAFVPFYTTSKKGSGIGLSLSRQIVLQHNGEMQMTSHMGEGTTVTLRLPVELENVPTDQ